MSKSQRLKGHNFERKVASILRPVFPHAKRELEYQHSDGVDLQNTGRFKIQCRKHKRYVSPSQINDVKIKNKCDIPLLVTAADHKKPIVCLYLEDFVALLKETEIRGTTEKLYLHQSRLPLDSVVFSNQKQLDMFDNECQGVCGV